MANMSYCRFQNTAKDLQDCLDHIDDENLSAEENRAKARLVRLCQEIASLFDDGDADGDWDGSEFGV